MEVWYKIFRKSNEKRKEENNDKEFKKYSKSQ